MIVKLLIDAGVDVNKRAAMSDFTNNTELVSNITALNVAAQWDQAPVIIELVKAGADVNRARRDGITPLFQAAKKGHEAAVARLLAAKAEAAERLMRR